MLKVKFSPSGKTSVRNAECVSSVSVKLCLLLRLHLKFFEDNSAFVSYILVMMKFGELIDRYLNLRPSPHVSRYVWKRRSFSPFSRKNSNRFRTLKRRDRIPYGACVMLEVYDVMTSLHWKAFVFVRPHLNQKPAFSKISTLENVFEKMRFRWPFSPDTCER